MKLIGLLFLLLISLPGFGQEEVKEEYLDIQKELKNLGHDSFSASSLMDEKVVRLIQKVFQSSTLHKESAETVRGLVLDKSKGTFLEGYLKSHPKVVDTFVEVLRDKQAMSSLVGIMLKRDDLKIYFYIWLSIIIGVWLIKKFWVKKKKRWSGTKKFTIGLLLSLGATATSLTVFYNMFHDELSPTAHILVKNWRGRNLH